MRAFPPWQSPDPKFPLDAILEGDSVLVCPRPIGIKFIYFDCVMLRGSRLLGRFRDNYRDHLFSLEYDWTFPAVPNPRNLAGACLAREGYIKHDACKPFNIRATNQCLYSEEHGIVFDHPKRNDKDLMREFRDECDAYARSLGRPMLWSPHFVIENPSPAQLDKFRSLWDSAYEEWCVIKQCPRKRAQWRICLQRKEADEREAERERKWQLQYQADLQSTTERNAARKVRRKRRCFNVIDKASKRMRFFGVCKQLVKEYEHHETTK